MSDTSLSCAPRPPPMRRPIAATIAASFEQYRGKLEPESGAFRETAEAIAGELARDSGAIVAERNGEILGCVMVKLLDGDLYFGRLVGGAQPRAARASPGAWSRRSRTRRAAASSRACGWACASCSPRTSGCSPRWATSRSAARRTKASTIRPRSTCARRYASAGRPQRIKSRHDDPIFRPRPAHRRRRLDRRRDQAFAALDPRLPGRRPSRRSTRRSPP